MAHFAQLDENNIVIQIVVVNNQTIGYLDFPESEPVGVEFCKSLFGEDTVWKQTSYNNKFRGNFAAVGNQYNDRRDRFDDLNPIIVTENPVDPLDENLNIIKVTRIQA